MSDYSEIRLLISFNILDSYYYHAWFKVPYANSVCNNMVNLTDDEENKTYTHSKLSVNGRFHSCSSEPTKAHWNCYRCGKGHALATMLY